MNMSAADTIRTSRRFPRLSMTFKRSASEMLSEMLTLSAIKTDISSNIPYGHIGYPTLTARSFNDV